MASQHSRPPVQVHYMLPPEDNLLHDSSKEVLMTRVNLAQVANWQIFPPFPCRMESGPGLFDAARREAFCGNVATLQKGEETGL